MAIPKGLEAVSPLMAIIGGLTNKKKAGSGGGAASAGSFKRGGKVKKTGRAKVHKGEVVLTAKQARKAKRTKRGASKR